MAAARKTAARARPVQRPGVARKWAGESGMSAMDMDALEVKASEPMGPCKRYFRNSKTWPECSVIISRTPRAKGGRMAHMSGARRAQAETSRNQHQMGAYQRAWMAIRW